MNRYYEALLARPPLDLTESIRKIGCRPCLLGSTRRSELPDIFEAPPNFMVLSGPLSILFSYPDTSSREALDKFRRTIIALNKRPYGGIVLDQQKSLFTRHDQVTSIRGLISPVHCRP